MKEHENSFKLIYFFHKSDIKQEIYDHLNFVGFDDDNANVSFLLINEYEA